MQGSAGVEDFFFDLQLTAADQSIVSDAVLSQDAALTVAGVPANSKCQFKVQVPFINPRDLH